MQREGNICQDRVVEEQVGSNDTLKNLGMLDMCMTLGRGEWWHGVGMGKRLEWGLLCDMVNDYV